MSSILHFQDSESLNELPSTLVKKKKALGMSKEEKLGVNTCGSSSWYVCKDHVRLPFQCIFYVLKIRQCFDVFNFIKEQGTEKPENSLATAFF